MGFQQIDDTKIATSKLGLRVSLLSWKFFYECSFIENQCDFPIPGRIVDAPLPLTISFDAYVLQNCFS